MAVEQPIRPKITKILKIRPKIKKYGQLCSCFLGIRPYFYRYVAVVTSYDWLGRSAPMGEGSASLLERSGTIGSRGFERKSDDGPPKGGL